MSVGTNVLYITRSLITSEKMTNRINFMPRVIFNYTYIHYTYILKVDQAGLNISYEFECICMIEKCFL